MTISGTTKEKVTAREGYGKTGADTHKIKESRFSEMNKLEVTAGCGRRSSGRFQKLNFAVR